MAAAKQAVNRFDIELALRLAGAARDTGGGYPATELLGVVLLFADQPERAMQVLADDEAQAGTPHQRGRWMTLRAAVAFWGLDRADAIDQLSAAARAVDDPAAVARVRAFEAMMRLHLKETATAATLADDVLSDPAAEGSAQAMARCVLALLRSMRGDQEGSAELLAEVDAHTAEWRRDSPSLQYVRQTAVGTRAVVSLDLPGLDAIVSTEFTDLVESGGFGFGSGWVALLRARAALLRGRTGEALRASEQACGALSGNRLYDGNAHAVRAAVAAMRGDTELARASMAAADRAAATCTEFFYLWREQGRAWTTAGTGDLAAAVAQAQHLADRLQHDGFTAAELLIRYDMVRWGHAERAADRAADLVAGGVGGGAAPLLLRHARTAADRDGGGLLAVARDFSAQGYNVFAAEAAGGAVGLFRSARDARALGASTLLADVLAGCGTLRTPAVLAVQPSITLRERQVAELAAAGVRSRDIADRLFLSSRTVENHLQRVYQKLGVTGRAELAQALRSLPPSTVS
jgi:DNA-binding CsgD family transcriptional regulator